MKIQYLLSLVAMFFVLTACGTTDVATDYDRNVDFSQYKTYNFYTNIQWGKTNGLDQTRILNAIEHELNAKGMAKVEAPDLLIDIKTHENEVKRNAGNIGIGSGNYGRRGGVGVSVGIPISRKRLHKNYIVEMVDSKTNNLVWQGVFEKDISPNSDNTEVISAAMNKLLSKYPPQKK